MAISKFATRLAKHSANKLDVDKMVQQIHKIRTKAVNPTLAKKGWSVKVKSNGWEPVKDKEKKVYTYFVTLVFQCNPKRARVKESIDAEFAKIEKIVNTVAQKVQWELQAIGDSEVGVKPQIYVKTKIPENWLRAFKHLYERDDQIKIVLSAIQAGIRSNWEDRHHCLLAGPAATGKTELLQCVKNMVGPDSVLEYDATATTQAGAIKDLNERDELPRIMIVEEIEKVDENSLRWMLSVLDHRAEIRKTTYRGSIHRSVKLLCLATCNDFELLKKMMFGALVSRFSNKIYVPPPGEAILRKILEREVERVNGNPKWIKPTLKYCIKHKISDPRRVIAICLCGGNDLLDGSYQGVLDRTDIEGKKWKVE